MTASSLFIICLSLAAMVLETQSIFLPKRDNGYDGRDTILDPKKRPFCNAFTGCGRKRSNLPPLPALNQNNAFDENVGNLLDLSAEPAVEDLSRQIMSEAKLWEAIQEANMELLRRKQESGEIFDRDPSSPSRSAPGSCAVPPCYI